MVTNNINFSALNTLNSEFFITSSNHFFFLNKQIIWLEKHICYFPVIIMWLNKNRSVGSFIVVNTQSWCIIIWKAPQRAHIILKAFDIWPNHKPLWSCVI